jgi:hypothetical protein
MLREGVDVENAPPRERAIVAMKGRQPRRWVITRLATSCPQYAHFLMHRKPSVTEFPSRGRGMGASGRGVASRRVGWVVEDARQRSNPRWMGFSEPRDERQRRAAGSRSSKAGKAEVIWKDARPGWVWRAAGGLLRGASVAMSRVHLAIHFTELLLSSIRRLELESLLHWRGKRRKLIRRKEARFLCNSALSCPISAQATSRNQPWHLLRLWPRPASSYRCRRPRHRPSTPRRGH